MKSTNRGNWKIALTIAAVIPSIFTWFALSSEIEAGEKKLDSAKLQAERGFTTVKDWNLKAENISPRGENPYYFPLKPGFKYIFENPKGKFGALRKEVIVLEETEKFDVPGIGKFETAVVQEEEFYDGVYFQQAKNWFAIDKETGAMYAFGEISWEIDHEGRKVFSGTWRVGEPDGNGMAEPGMLMPGTLKVGDKYIFDGHEAETYGYTENIETGLKMTVPAGTFENCIRTREYSLTTPSDITDKWWCKDVGEVKDTSDGELIASTAVPGSDLSSFGKFHRNPVKVTTPPVPKIDSAQAIEIALNEIPGKANSTKIERLGKHNVYAVEVIADKDGGEWDVFVDIETGKVVGTDN
jgi:hypothetical protein